MGFIAISYGGSELRHRSILETITHRPKSAKYKSCRYYIPLHFDTNPESLRPFVPEIWPNNVFNLSATLKFCENTDKQTHTQTNTQTDRHGHYNTSPSPSGGEVKIECGKSPNVFKIPIVGMYRGNVVKSNPTEPVWALKGRGGGGVR